GQVQGLEVRVDVGLVAQGGRRGFQCQGQSSQPVDDLRQSGFVVDPALVAEKGHGLLRGERLQGDAVVGSAALPDGVDGGDQNLAAVSGLGQQLPDGGVVLRPVVDQQRPGPG